MKILPILLLLLPITLVDDSSTPGATGIEKHLAASYGRIFAGFRR